MKFCKAMHEKWRGNVNEVKEGPRRNSENCENHHKNAKITNTTKFCWAINEKWRGNVNEVEDIMNGQGTDQIHSL